MFLYSYWGKKGVIVNLININLPEESPPSNLISKNY